MNIIFRGIPPEEKQVRLECKNCSTVFEIFRKEGGILQYRNGSLLTHVCPVCNRDVYVNI